MCDKNKKYRLISNEKKHPLRLKWVGKYKPLIWFKEDNKSFKIKKIVIKTI